MPSLWIQRSTNHTWIVFLQYAYDHDCRECIWIWNSANIYTTRRVISIMGTNVTFQNVFPYVTLKTNVAFERTFHTMGNNVARKGDFPLKTLMTNMALLCFLISFYNLVGATVYFRWSLSQLFFLVVDKRPSVKPEFCMNTHDIDLARRRFHYYVRGRSFSMSFLELLLK